MFIICRFEACVCVSYTAVRAGFEPSSLTVCSGTTLNTTIDVHLTRERGNFSQQSFTAVLRQLIRLSPQAGAATQGLYPKLYII